jgi:predicted transcriptional regulator
MPMSQQSYGLLLSVRVDNGLRNALKAIAKKNDLTLTQVVRKALREFLERNKQ